MQLSSIQKCFRIIDFMSKKSQPLSLAELSRGLGFPKSTTHHILDTLISEGYFYKESETRKYSLGYKFLEISRGILDNIDIRSIAHKYLRMLQEDCKETIHLTILRKVEVKVIFIDKISASDGLSLVTYIGLTSDPHCHAGGKALLSQFPPSEIMDIYKDRPFKSYTQNTITSISKLLEELEEIRKRGYAIDNEEYLTGVRCVAAPISIGGKAVAAVSITGSIFTMTLERINRELSSLVMATAKKISSQMRW